MLDDLFSSLCSEHLTMLDNTFSEMSLNAAPYPPNSSDEKAAQAILSILRSSKQDRVFRLIQGLLTECTTPDLGNDDFALNFTTLLIAEDDDPGDRFHDTPMFDDAGLFESPTNVLHYLPFHLSISITWDV